MAGTEKTESERRKSSLAARDRLGAKFDIARHARLLQTFPQFLHQNLIGRSATAAGAELQVLDAIALFQKQEGVRQFFQPLFAGHAGEITERGVLRIAD